MFIEYAQGNNCEKSTKFTAPENNRRTPVRLETTVFHQLETSKNDFQKQIAFFGIKLHSAAKGASSSKNTLFKPKTFMKVDGAPFDHKMFFSKNSSTVARKL